MNRVDRSSLRLGRRITSTDPLGDLFVISNMGQLRHALLAADQIDGVEPEFLILWTEIRASLSIRLMDYAHTSGGVTHSLKLPSSPTDLFPTRINKIERLYMHLVAELPAAVLWIANTNNHYGRLARLYAEKGAQINYFEEGLASYRRAHLPPFQPAPLRARVKNLRADVVAAANNLPLSVCGRLRRIGHLLASFFANTYTGQLLCAAATRGRSRDHHRAWSEFDTAAVVFPQALDSNLIHAVKLRTIVQPTKGEPLVAEAVEWLAGWDKEGDSVTLFVSQHFRVPTPSWASAIGRTLADSGHTQVIVKFHPREPGNVRAAMLLGLENAGVAVASHPELDRWPAETLIAAGIASQVIGLSSSTILYGAVKDDGIDYWSIGQPVLRALDQDPNVRPTDLRQYRDDLTLFEQVKGAIEWVDR